MEDVVETEPVADFVGGGGTLVEVCGGAAGHGVGEVDAAVEGEVGGGGVGDGEVAPSESAAGDVGGEVKVELAVATLLQGSLHAALSGGAKVGSGPLGVDGEVGGLQAESDAHARVGVVHDGDLVVDLGLGVPRALGLGGNDVDIDGNVASSNTADLLFGSTESGSLVQRSDLLSRRVLDSTSVVLGAGEAGGDGSQAEGRELHGGRS